MTHNTRKKKCTLYHQEGVDAAWKGKDRNNCPYAKGPDQEKRSWWQMGFDAAIRVLGRLRPEKKDED